MRRYLVTALIILLVLAQSALLAHELDLSAHSDGHACEYCALTGSLDKPVAGLTVPIDVASGGVDGFPLRPFATTSATATFNARAPPAIS